MSTTAPDKPALTPRPARRERLVLGLLAALLAGLVVHHMLTLPLPRVLVVAAPRQARTQGAPHAGPERELLERFQRLHGVEVRFVLTRTPEEALELVEQGHAQIGLALGVAPAELDKAETASPAGRTVVFGPEYDRQPIYAVDWEEGFLPVGVLRPDMDELVRVSASFSLDPVLAPALPLDALHLLLPFLPEVRDAAPTGRMAGYRFVWRTDVPRLDEAMRAFWALVRSDGTLAALHERTLGFLPEDPDPFEMELLRRTLALNVPPHVRTINRAAKKWGLDPHLLTAVIHQESRFDPRAVSATGVRGLMQMTGDTLEFLGVADPDDPVEVIAAGARYLDMLRGQFMLMGYGREEGLLLGLAAFNVGQGHVQDAIELARGQSPHLPAWVGVRRELMRLGNLDVAKGTRYGLCRGLEAVDFVDKVRYFAFAIRGLALVGPDRDELSGLRLALAD